MLIRSKAITNQNDKPVRKPLDHPARLSQLQRTAILDDYIIGMPWREIAKKHDVSTTAIARVRRDHLVREGASQNLKKARLPMLYEISSWILESFDVKELEEASLRERGRLFGTLQDKINQIEGVTGNVNIAITTMTDLGLLK